MMTWSRHPFSVCLPPCACLLALLAGPPPAGAVSPARGGRAGTDVGDANEPLFLRKVIKEKLKARRDKERNETDPNGACRKALDSENEEDIAKHCKKSPGVVLGTAEPTDIINGTKRTGKKVKATTRIKYKHPGQAFGHEGREKWDRLVVRPPSTGDMTARQFRPASSNTRDKARGRALLGSTPGSQATNDDGDCYDRVTGTHAREEACFEGGASRSLRRTLEPVEGGCLHVPTGTLLPGNADDQEDDCYDAAGVLKTSLVELIDEDPESPYLVKRVHGPEVRVYDVDGDNAFGEDGRNGVNDDGDCVDRVTGKHLGASACLDPLGRLNPTLEPAEGGCRHVESGLLLEGDPTDGADDACYDAAGALKTTLAVLIDEDDGQPVDDDDDGRFDEDGPSAPPPGFAADCRQLGKDAGLSDTKAEAMVTPDGGCDLTPVIVKKVNEKANERFGKRVFQTDDPSAPPEDPGHPPVEYGAEERAVELTEEVTITCDEGMELDDPSGQCIDRTKVAALAEARAQALAATGTNVVRDEAMMGFTFAPPRVRWGLFRHDEVCFWFFGCFTLFEAKIGFDFSLGLGFRLPVEVTVSGVPTTPVLAGGEVDGLGTTLMPLDFDAAQYEAFCRGQTPPMGDTAFCQRFAFPNALVPEQGDELAIRFTAFAGIKIVVVEIPIVDWGIDVGADVPELCSLALAWMNSEDVARELPGQGFDLGRAITAAGYNCGTYTTPFGKGDDGEPRSFPVMGFFDQMIRADCLEAFARGETMQIGGKTVPLCTGLIVGIPGASLGLGLGAELELGSDRIEAMQTASGDGEMEPASARVQYRQSANEPDATPIPLAAVKVDNYDDRDFADDALVSLGDLTYCLNQFSVRLKGQAMFGGILTILPDFDDFTIYRFSLPDEVGCGVPVGQHAQTDDTVVRVGVLNHALEVAVETKPGDPNAVDLKTLKIKPGDFGEFLVGGRNLGSATDTFDAFSLALSNSIQARGPFQFGIDRDNDHDGRIDEDDFGPDGLPKESRDTDKDGVADEDPPDNWRAEPADLPSQALIGVEPYRTAEDRLTLRISPFAHPSTRPGVYPFQVTADSRRARELGLADADVRGHRRKGAADVGFIEVVAFRDVRVAVTPPEAALKPGLIQTYAIEGSNMGNVSDSMTLALQFRDSNQAGCGLPDLGSRPGCPERAWPTRIDPAWTTAGGLPGGFGPMEPLGLGMASFNVTVPREWEGMRDTPYEFEVKVESPARGLDPPVSRAVVGRHRVVATKESMTRYIRHEVLDLIAAIEAANAAGVQTGGLRPIAVHPVLQKVEQALGLLLSGDLDQASGPLTSGVKVAEAFLHALGAVERNVAAELAADWRSRAEAIRSDLAAAAASTVPSAP